MKYIKLFEEIDVDEFDWEDEDPNKDENERGLWYMQTKDVSEIRFYSYKNRNPLTEIPEFDRGKYWCIDGHDMSGEYDDLSEIYQQDLDGPDDSFVLIPKKDVLRVWFVSYKEDSRFAPKKIRRARPF